jgi:hypothetical protein
LSKQLLSLWRMSQALFIIQILEKADCIFTLFPIFITLMSRAHHKNRHAKSSPSIWIEVSHGTVLGNGGVPQLERMQECGSITKAAKSLEMYCRRP